MLYLLKTWTPSWELRASASVAWQVDSGLPCCPWTVCCLPAFNSKVKHRASSELCQLQKGRPRPSTSQGNSQWGRRRKRDNLLEREKNPERPACSRLRVSAIEALNCRHILRFHTFSFLLGIFKTQRLQLYPDKHRVNVKSTIFFLLIAVGNSWLSEQQFKGIILLQNPHTGSPF